MSKILYVGMIMVCVVSCQKRSVQFDQYYAQGEDLYVRYCSNCHQKSGKGLRLVYPPLENSDYLRDHFKDVVCLIRFGKKGELIVNGKSFNKPMPGIRALTELELAEVTTYIYNNWGQDRGQVSLADVRSALSGCQE
jgi:cytochrome c551